MGAGEGGKGGGQGRGAKEGGRGGGAGEGGKTAKPVLIVGGVE
jgi:hypothetical protein